MRILATNDDGIMAPGLVAIRRALAGLGEVTVVAPTTPQSAVGHSISLTEPVLCHRMDLGEGAVGFGIEGSPADCVKLALLELLPERPDLVVSGLNLGANVGINVLYSGTVAAAVEGAFYGVPSAAVSLEDGESVDFEAASRLAAGLIEQFVARLGGLAGRGRRAVRPESGALLNINIPNLSPGPPKGVKVVPQSLKGWRERWDARRDPRGRTYYWITGDPQAEDAGAETDVSALAARYVTVTPLQWDLTDHARLAVVQGWGFNL
ncbi:MAG: 5'/3'-nucleotidase SurE [Phycisphaerae bacterium]|nr:5'/3'-nucleotidase SurE [Phycisphaerae bacterium]